MSHLDHTYALILAGGGGTRLWPKSRNKTPKQFLSLVSDDTMLQVTADRINKLIPWERIIVVTNQLYKDEITKQLPHLPQGNVLAEPAKRDTALAMLVGALYAKQQDPDAIVINCASDHVVTDEEGFVEVMKAASEMAGDHQYLVSVGVTPTRPATGFGYIKIGQDIKQITDKLKVFKVDSFTEKPDEATAKEFIATGRYFWNANMYVWSAQALQDAFKKYMPSLYEVTKSLTEMSQAEFHDALPSIYDNAEAISIDYAISEKADNLVLIPGDFGWNDVGDWKVVYDLGTKNLDGNVIIGEKDQNNTLAVQSQNNLIHTNGKLIALVGISDMIIVDTEEILMIVPKSISQDVKKLVEKLKEEKREDYL